MLIPLKVANPDLLVDKRLTALFVACAALAACSTSQEQGPYGPAENIPVIYADVAEINEVLGKYALVRVDGIPTLVGPQR